MGALVFFLFCLGVIIAVICIIIYLSSPKKEKKINGLVVLKREEKDMKSEDDHPLMKRGMDDNYYKEKILELRDSPNFITDIFIKWKTLFKSRQELAMLGRLEEWYNSIKAVSGAKADATQEMIRAHVAQIDLGAVKTQKYEEERGETKILEAQAENEELRARRAEAKRRQEGPKEESPAPSEAPKPRPTEEEVRQRKVSRFHTIADDEIALDEAQAQKLKELNERKMKDEDRVYNDQNISEPERQRQLREIESRYINLRKKILTTTGGKT